MIRENGFLERAAFGLGEFVVKTTLAAKEVVVNHPKPVLAVIALVSAISFAAWRAAQPFDSFQPALIGFGTVALAAGHISQRLEKRDGPRKGATTMAYATMAIGATCLYLGLRPL